MLTRAMASQRVFEDVVEDAVEVEDELEVEAYRRDRVTVDLEPAPRPLHPKCREDIEDFMGRTREKTGCYKRRIVEKANRGEIGFVTDGKPIGRSTLEVNCFAPLGRVQLCTPVYETHRETSFPTLSTCLPFVAQGLAGVSRREWRV